MEFLCQAIQSTQLLLYLVCSFFFFKLYIYMLNVQLIRFFFDNCYKMQQLRRSGMIQFICYDFESLREPNLSCNNNSDFFPIYCFLWLHYRQSVFRWWLYWKYLWSICKAFGFKSNGGIQWYVTAGTDTTLKSKIEMWSKLVKKICQNIRTPVHKTHVCVFKMMWYCVSNILGSHVCTFSLESHMLSFPIFFLFMIFVFRDNICIWPNRNR